MFAGNDAKRGGAVYNQGDVTTTNCTFSANSAETAGGVYGYSSDTRVSITTVDNCIFWNNSDDGGAGESAQIGGGPDADLTVNHTCVMGWTGALGGTGNIGDDPLFVDADGPDDIIGTLDDNLRLPAESPCFNAGDNTALPADIFDLDGDGNTDEPIPFDLDRDHRVANQTVDMGAYECSTDCNNNGISDDLDIAAGTSEDCTVNGIPDECEPDCNTNDSADSCDILEGTSEDCNSNDIPDECDLTGGTSDDCNVNNTPDECEPDADDDGTIDDCDGCPNDANKLEPGVCGCGLPDDDTDGDTVLDCNDVCPGFDDLQDSDTDGVPDGCDRCEGYDDGQDNDGDTVPDGCDQCEGFDDREDGDGDGVPDGCDRCEGYDDSLDCNQNGFVDGCDILEGTSHDINDNGIPDECDPPTAMAAGCRYVSLTPVSGPDPVALLVTSPELACLSKYVNASGRLVDQPVFRLPEEWGTVHVGDAQIAPGTVYTIQTDRGDVLSAAATATTARWGDVVGRLVDGSWMPPDGSVDIPDAMAVIDRFRNLPSAPPLEWADLYPQIPNGTVEILDASMVIDAFRALPYPYDPPCP